MELKTKIENQVALLLVDGSIDGPSDRQWLADTARKLLSANPSCLVIDLSQVSFATASLCGALIATYKDTICRKASFKIVVPRNDPVYQVLELASIDRIVTIYENLSMCLAVIASETKMMAAQS